MIIIINQSINQLDYYYNNLSWSLVLAASSVDDYLSKQK